MDYWRDMPYALVRFQGRSCGRSRSWPSHYRVGWIER